jgi:hypothetical protein
MLSNSIQNSFLIKAKSVLNKIIFCLEVLVDQKTMYYSALAFGLVLSTYSLTMAGVTAQLGNTTASNYFILMVVMAISPIFIMNIFLLNSFLANNNYPRMVKILNIVSYTLFSAILSLIIYKLCKDTNSSRIAIYSFMLMFYLIGYVSLFVKDLSKYYKDLNIIIKYNFDQSSMLKR